MESIGIQLFWPNNLKNIIAIVLILFRCLRAIISKMNGNEAIPFFLLKVQYSVKG